MKPVVIMCQPLYGHVPGGAHSNHMAFLYKNGSRGLLHGYQSRLGAYIDEARNKLCDMTLSCKPATHLLFVDQDMILPDDLLPVLLEDDKEVVSAVYFGKDEKSTIVAWESLDPVVRLQDFDRERVQMVAGVGMGACLIQTSVLRAMADYYDDKDWFRSDRVGEDLHFCKRLDTMNIPVWLDGRVQCGHITDAMVTIRQWESSNSYKETPTRN